MTYLNKPSTPGELVRFEGTSNGSRELAHFGVKGMKWGVRKAKKPVTLAEGYTQRQYNLDRKNWSKRSANRINERVKAGKTVKQARVSEANRRALVRLGAFAGAFVALHLAQSASFKISDRAIKNRQAAGARAAANMFADKRGVPSYSTINLAFDKASNTWA